MKIFLTASCLAFAGAAAAQDTILLRHANGQPLLSGPCTFFVNPYAATNLNGAVTFGQLYGGRNARQAGPFTSQYDFGGGNMTSPDADQNGIQSFGEKPLINLIGLGFLCDGPVTLYYSTGARLAEVPYQRGVPSGQYTEYYPDGTVAVRAALDRGMPAGTWTRYYKTGTRYASGNFRAAPATYLRDAWEGLLNRKEGEDWEEAKGWKPRRDWGAEGVRISSQNTRDALHGLLWDFHLLLGAMPQHGIPTGKFSFLNRDGSALANVQFDTAGTRTGIWTIWNARGKVRSRLHYSAAGELTHVTDSTGIHTTVANYTARWQERETRAREARARTPVTGAIQEAPDAIDPGLAPGIVVEAPAPSTYPRDYVYTMVDQQPEFSGDIRAFLAANMRVPTSCNGRVLVQFVVEEDGRLSNVKVLRSLSPVCDAEAMRAVRAMPKWKPGKLNGKTVRSYFNLPVKMMQPE